MPLNTYLLVIECHPRGPNENRLRQVVFSFGAIEPANSVSTKKRDHQCESFNMHANIINIVENFHCSTGTTS